MPKGMCSSGFLRSKGIRKGAVSPGTHTKINTVLYAKGVWGKGLSATLEKLFKAMDIRLPLDAMHHKG